MCPMWLLWTDRKCSAKLSPSLQPGLGRAGEDTSRIPNAINEVERGQISDSPGKGSLGPWMMVGEKVSGQMLHLLQLQGEKPGDGDG